jgi:hypothetical protein
MLEHPHGSTFILPFHPYFNKIHSQKSVLQIDFHLQIKFIHNCNAIISAGIQSIMLLLPRHTVNSIHTAKRFDPTAQGFDQIVNDYNRDSIKL